MLHAFGYAIGQFCWLIGVALVQLFRGPWIKLPRRLLITFIALPAIILLQVAHWVGFCCDAIFFRQYRKVNVQKPVFVSGIPRSGTTHLQRVLARHEELTSTQMWECLFAPSITERHIFSVFGRLLSPLLRKFGGRRRSLFKRLDGIHKLGLHEAEEDFIALLPVNACFLIVLLFPDQEHFWRLVKFDLEMPPSHKKIILNFYRRIIQKHLYFHGQHKRYLCKNPSFATWVNDLHQYFPDARFVLCEREASKTVPSQLSSLEPGWKLLQGGELSERFSERIVKMLAYYYHYQSALDYQASKALSLPMSQLVEDLEASVKLVLEHCQLTLTEDFNDYLQLEVAKAKEYKSGHHYTNRKTTNWADWEKYFPETALEQ